MTGNRCRVIGVWSRVVPRLRDALRSRSRDTVPQSREIASSSGAVVTACRRLLHPGDLDPQVIPLQNLLVRPAAEGHAVRADLAEADAVPPSLAEERVALGAVGV